MAEPEDKKAQDSPPGRRFLTNRITSEEKWIIGLSLALGLLTGTAVFMLV